MKCGASVQLRLASVFVQGKGKYVGRPVNAAIFAVQGMDFLVIDQCNVYGDSFVKAVSPCHRLEA